MGLLSKVVVPDDAEVYVKEIGKILSLKGLFEVKLTIRDLEVGAISKAMNVMAIMPISQNTLLSDFDTLIDKLREYCLSWEATFVHPVRSISGALLVTNSAADVANSVMQAALYKEQLIFEAARDSTIYKAIFSINNIQLIFIDRSSVIYSFEEGDTIRRLMRFALQVRDCIDGQILKNVEVRPMNCP